MQSASILISAAASLVAVVLGIGGAAAGDHSVHYRVSGPVVHENLAVYFLHGSSSDGPVPLTLEEALARKLVRVDETGSVNQLTIENLGPDEVFIQSGDIVKGGRQDRALMASLILPPGSGKVPIASFCVEHGRWTPRGEEDAHSFATASTAVPSRAAKIAMKAPPVAPAAPSQIPIYAEALGTRQQEVWRDVAEIQAKLASRLGGSVASPVSGSSLQLSLESEKLKDVQAAYVKALEGAGEADTDIVGFVFAINGKLNSADTYPSNALFRKMWHKLLSASATEAIGDKDAAAENPPSIEAVTAFLDDAEAGKASEKTVTERVNLLTRDADNAVYFETRRKDGGWIHRNYLAK